MKAISFNNNHLPFTIKAETSTIKGLRDALNILIEKGYGDVSIVRADSSGDFGSSSCLEFYNTDEEKEKGYLDCDKIFLIC